MKWYIKSDYSIEYKDGLYEVQDEMGTYISEFLTKDSAERFIKGQTPALGEMYEYEFILPNEGDLQFNVFAKGRKEAWRKLYKCPFNTDGAYLYE